MAVALAALYADRRGAADRARARRDLAARDQGTNQRTGDPGRGRDAAPARAPVSAYTALALVALIGVLTLIDKGSIPEGTFLGLIIFAVIAAAVPPLGVIVGLVVVVYLLYTGAAVNLQTWLGTVMAANQPVVQEPYAPLGPSVPGWTPPGQGALPKF